MVVSYAICRGALIPVIHIDGIPTNDYTNWWEMLLWCKDYLRPDSWVTTGSETCINILDKESAVMFKLKFGA